MPILLMPFGAVTPMLTATLTLVAALGAVLLLGAVVAAATIATFVVVFYGGEWVTHQWGRRG